MNAKGFVEEVAVRVGAEDHEAVARMVAVTLSVLGQRLRPVDARAVAARLPESLAVHLLESHASGERSPSSLGWGPEEVLRRLGANDSDDSRMARTVCRVLAEALDEQARAQLRMQDIKPLFDG